jgi:hypothetical protein
MTVISAALYVIEAFYVDPEGPQLYNGVRGIWIAQTHLKASTERNEGCWRLEKQRKQVPKYPLRLVRFAAEEIVSI